LRSISLFIEISERLSVSNPAFEIVSV